MWWPDRQSLDHDGSQAMSVLAGGGGSVRTRPYQKTRALAELPLKNCPLVPPPNRRSVGGSPFGRSSSGGSRGTGTFTPTSWIPVVTSKAMRLPDQRCVLGRGAGAVAYYTIRQAGSFLLLLGEFGMVLLETESIVGHPSSLLVTIDMAAAP